jgi:hypothetical protein
VNIDTPDIILISFALLMAAKGIVSLLDYRRIVREENQEDPGEGEGSS